MARGIRRAASILGAGAVPVALLAGLTTGCSLLETKPEPDRKTHGDNGTGGAKPAEIEETVVKGGTVGAKGSACALPVTFDFAKDWKPEAVKLGAEVGLSGTSTVNLVCEIDAKPAGSIGFLRVWTGERAGEDPRRALQLFVADNAKSREQEEYHRTRAGEYDAVEVSYLNTDELLGEPKKEHAFAFATPQGVVVLHLGGLDSAEQEAMLPAYGLAKKTLRAL
ncbi:lipoprotein [Streptomyces sp. NPDC014894]|uniref:lipoprotein n=1 Tax=unclassified Streptomyces TaxID=2593676 RepID=UPI0036FDA0A6